MRRRGGIMSDLTPLLDVIFIILFMVMIRNVDISNRKLAEARQYREEADQIVADIQQEKEEAIARIQEEKDAAVAEAERLQLKAEAEVAEFENLLVNAIILRVSIEDGEDGSRLAVVRSGSQMQSSSFDWDNTEDAFQYLEKALASYITTVGEDDPVFITFSYDSNKIYRSDYTMVEQAMQDVQKEHANVYLQYREESEEVSSDGSEESQEP